MKLIKIFNLLVRKAIFFTLFSAFLLVIFPVTLFVLSILRIGNFRLNNKLLLHLFRFWFYASGVKVTGEGKDNLPGDTAYILASNHQSALDLASVMCALNVPFRPVIAEGFFRAPVPSLNYVIRKCGCLPIPAGPSSNFKKRIDEIVKVLSEGESILIFPEGITTQEGELRRFKWGVSQIALNSGRPVVPVAIKGTNRILPSFFTLFRNILAKQPTRLGLLFVFIKILFYMFYGFSPGNAKVAVGKPMIFSGYKEASLDVFRDIAEKLENEVRVLLQRL